MELVKGDFKVEWDAIGEGLAGDYNPRDPGDVELLRFYFLRRDKTGGWEEIDDGSYCTQFPAAATVPQQQEGLCVLMEVAYPVLVGKLSFKKVGELLSWIGLDNQGHAQLPTRDQISAYLV